MSADKDQRIADLERQVERAYQQLEINGVLRERAKSVSNGIDVLVTRLMRQVAAEKERADYSWRNTNTIEKARQDEMAKRNALTEQVAALTKENERLKNVPMKYRRMEFNAQLQEQLAAVVQQRDEYRDTVAQQAELLAAHKAEMQDWQRQLLSAQQERDELLTHRDALLIDLAASLYREDKRIRERDELLAALKKMLCCDVAEVRTIPESIGALQAARAAIAKVQP